jgi:hypothetical protein
MKKKQMLHLLAEKDMDLIRAFFKLDLAKHRLETCLEMVL